MSTTRFMLLVRHAETAKNISRIFGGNETENRLTAHGLDQVRDIAKAISTWLDQLNVPDWSVVSSASPRALSCAEEVVGSLGGSLSIDGRLSPLGQGEFLGRSETDIARALPAFHQRLLRYRAGLHNCYDLGHPGEDLRAFESRVHSALGDCEAAGHRVSILFGHESTNTAALIHYARRFHEYPPEYYGYTDLPPGSLSLIALTPPGEIAMAGVSARQFPAAFAAWAG